MFAFRRFQYVVDQVCVLLVAVRDQVPLTDWLFFLVFTFFVFVFTFVGCVECRVTNCCGLWCRGGNALFQRSGLLQQLLCHVEACFEGARSYVHLVFLFSRRVRGGDTDFLWIGIVFQRATRRKAHCLFVVALHSWSWYCFRGVVAIVSEFRHCVSSERSVIFSVGIFSYLSDSWSHASRGF